MIQFRLPCVPLLFCLSLLPFLLATAPPAGKTLIWAGHSGKYPKYIDSGPNRGMGWLEVPTAEVRKSLREAGFMIQQEYMTPARIAYEFKSGNPICTFPEDWQNPESTFSVKSDRVYSIPIEYKGEEGHSIMVHRSELSRFAKYRDAKGDIQIDGLLKDPSLKTLLVQEGDYGLLGKRLTTRDEKGDQILRPEYRKNIEIRVIRDSLQLLEMLNSHRFDYIFSDSIEETDFEVLKKQGITRDQFVDLRFETHPITSIQDPRITRTSVACSLHPTAMAALLYINKKIKLIRSNDRTASMNKYRFRLDPRLRATEDNTILRSLSAFISSGKIDDWYPLQQKLHPGLQLFPPEEGQITAALGPLPPRESTLKWHAFSASPGSWTVLSDAEMHLLFENGVPPNLHYSYPRVNLGEFLDPALKACWRTQCRQTLHHPSLVALLGILQSQLSQATPLKTVTFFAGALDESELGAWVSLLEKARTSLTAVSFFDASPAASQVLTAHLPEGLERLNLTNSSLFRSQMDGVVAKLKQLKELRLDSTQIPPAEFERLVATLPSSLESLSLGYLRTAWTPEAIAKFAGQSLTKMKEMAIEANALSPAEIASFRKALPAGVAFRKKGNLAGGPTLENGSVLVVSSQSLASSKSEAERELLFESLLTQPGGKPRALRIEGVAISAKMAEALSTLPQLSEVEEFACSNCSLESKVLSKLALDRWRLRRLDLSKNWIDNPSVEKIAAELSPSLRELDLSSNNFGEEGVRVLSQKLPEKLESLSLASIQGVDAGALSSRLPKGLLRLDLSSNGLSDRDLEVLGPGLPAGLKSLNLTDSSFGPKGAWHLAKALPPQLGSLHLGGTPIGSRGLEFLASRLPQSLAQLSLGGFEADEKATLALSRNIPPRLADLKLRQIAFMGNGLQTFLSNLPRAVQSVNLFEIKISTEAARLFGANMPEHLRDLEIQGAQLNPSAAAALVASLPESVEDLWLMALPLGEEGMISFSKNELPNVFKIAFDNDHYGKKALAALNQKKRYFTDLALVSSKIDDRALEALGSNTLRGVKSLWIGNQPISGHGLVRLLKQMSPDATTVHIPSLAIQPSEVEMLIQALPKGLRLITVPGLPIGQKGYDAIRRHAAERAKAGVELKVVE